MLCLIGAAAEAGAATPLSPGQTDLARLAARHVPTQTISDARAYTARSVGKGCSLGRPSAKSPEGTTTPLRPTLTWSKVNGASCYDLEIYQENAPRRYFNGHHGTSRHLMKSLPANVDLTWRVRARAAGSTGAWSEGMKFIISPPRPQSPSGTVASATPTFEWNRLSGATKYDCSVSGGGVQLTQSGVSALSCRFGRALPTNVPLTWKVRGSNADGKGVWSRSVAFIVVPDHFPLTITASNQDKTYGTTLALGSSAFTSLGLLPGDSVTSVTLASAGAAAGAAVSGSPYAIVPSAATGSGLAKYDISYVSGALSVARKGLTVSGAVAQNKVYDGATTATVDFSGASLVGVLGGDAVTLVSSAYAASFASAEVGKDKPVTVTGLTLGGAAAGNYALSQPSGLSADVTAPPPSITLVGSLTATLQGRASDASCFIPTGTTTGDLVFAVIQAQDRSTAVPPLGPTVGDWTKIGDYSYTASISGDTHHFYHALYYLQVGASVPWHDKWDFFPAYLENISVMNVTYRRATYDTASNVPYTTDDTLLTAGSVTPAAAGELLLFIGGAYDPSSIGTVSVSTAPPGFTTNVNGSSNDFLAYAALATAPQASAAPSGTKTATLTTSTGLKQAWLVALKQ
jgi:hypothetical protein